MANFKLTGEPRFRLRQEPAYRPREAAQLQAWPTGQGDYALMGRDTYPIRQRIARAGGVWDRTAGKWYVTASQAEALRAILMARVLRAPACCERSLLGADGVEALATPAEVAAGRMTVRRCPHCDSYLDESVAIRDVDVEDCPELPRE